MRFYSQIELNAAKIRYDNELAKQNGLMQLKYDGLSRELHRLNDALNRLEREKKELSEQVRYERELNRKLMARRNDLIFSTLQSSSNPER